MNIVNNLKTAKTIIDFLTQKDITNLIADIGINAANNCLKDFSLVNSSTEKRKLVLSAINHLETTDAAYEKIVNNSYERKTTTWKWDEAKSKRKIVLCLIAACEKFLNNNERMEIVLAKAKETDNLEDIIDTTTIEGAFNAFRHGLNPSNYVFMVKAMFKSDPPSIRIDEFEEALRNKDGFNFDNFQN